MKKGETNLILKNVSISSPVEGNMKITTQWYFGSVLGLQGFVLLAS